ATRRRLFRKGRDGRVGSSSYDRRGAMTGTRWTRREVLQAGLEATGAVAIAGWPRRGAAQGAGAGTLRIGVGALPATLDPHKNTAGISMATYFQLYNGLTRCDVAGQLP